MNNFKGSVGIAAFAAIVSAVLTVVACGPTKECGPTNCSNGCCSEDGVCQTGLSNAQCGFAGGQCTSCTVTQLCQAGVCTEFGNQNGMDGGTNNKVQTCLKTCQGCCNADGECLSGTEATACGVGEQCVNCGTDKQCISGTCFDPTCSTCTTNGQCDATGGPSNNSACGNGGSPCQVCSGSGASCENGICVGSCTSGCVDPFGKCKNGNTAGACGSSGNACVACLSGNTCVNGVCQPIENDGGSCKSTGASCFVNAECCSNSCDGTGHCGEADAGSCKGIEASCSLNSDCCSNNCSSGFCSPPPTDGGCTKKSDGASCMFASECCSNQCNGGLCGAPPTSCDFTSCPSGCCIEGSCQPGDSDFACGSFAQACATCSTGTTCQPDDFGGRSCVTTAPPDAGGSCQPLSASCTSNFDCCSAACVSGVCSQNSSGTPIGTNCGGLTNLCASNTSAVPSASCDPCIAEICKSDPFCCGMDTSGGNWDGTCSGNDVATHCTGRCP